MTSPTATDLASLLGSWSEQGTGSLTTRLSFALRSSILSGLLASGAKLPPERQLAQNLSVSRHTLTNSLATLRSEGLLESTQGSGTYVSGPRLPKAADGQGQIERLLAPIRGINLAVAAPQDPGGLPDVSLNLNDLLNANPSHGYEPLGLVPLRERVATRFSNGGLPTGPEQVQITHGGYHAIDMALRILVSPGAQVGVASPNFPGIFDLLNHHGLTPVEILRDSQGLRPESLARACERGIEAVYLAPVVNNPTGQTMSPNRLQRIAAVLDEFEIPTIEDDTLAELLYDERSAARLAQLCNVAPVLTVGSISKVAWAGLRLGWLRVPESMAPIAARVRVGSDLGTSVPSQLFTIEIWDHLDALRTASVERLKGRLETLKVWLTAQHPDWEFEAPMGGLSAWIGLPLEDSQPFVLNAATAGVLVAPGSAAIIDQQASAHIRLCFDQPTRVLEAAFDLLDHTWAKIR